MIQRFQDRDIPKGLLVFAPFFLSVSSLLVGFEIGMVAFVFILLISSIVYFSCKLFVLPQQRLVFALILGVSLILIMRMLLDAEAYSLAQKTGLFLPLLIMNSLVLSLSDQMFSMPDFKSAMGHILKVGLATLMFFIISGFMQTLLNEISVFTSTAGFFFLSGFLFAVINLCKNSLIKYRVYKR